VIDGGVHRVLSVGSARGMSVDVWVYPRGHSATGVCLMSRPEDAPWWLGVVYVGCWRVGLMIGTWRRAECGRMDDGDS
jgi:hypothetical protein